MNDVANLTMERSVIPIASQGVDLSQITRAAALESRKSRLGDFVTLMNPRVNASPSRGT